MNLPEPVCDAIKFLFFMRLGFGSDSPGSSKNGNSGTPKGVSPASGRLGATGFAYADLPPISANEIEFFVESPTKRKAREQVRSPKKTVGPFTFDVLVFPGGNANSYTMNPKVAVYVECVDVADKDPRWVFNGVRFSVTIINLKDYRKSLYHEDTHTFSSVAIDRGWPELITHSELTAEAGWLDDQGRMCIRAWACSRQADTILMSSEYDTRKETGYIGLKNHGATCYLNGLLQSYFHLGKFREIVYKMHDVVKDAASSPSGGTRMSLPLALQSVFLRLEQSNTPVNCSELIRAFGWDSMDAFTQHDVQELARILCDRLEDKLKEMDGPEGHLPLQTLLEGKIENFIECVDVECKSRKIEAFYDIPVNVRGQANQQLHSLEASLADFVTPELMEGDNAYEAEGFGKQTAKKGIRFLSFPPVVSFQLKRFSFDFEKMDNVKLHDRFEFPTELLLANKKYLLHTVLVHAGDVNSGHYYAFVKVGNKCKNSNWLRFDDDQVSPCSEFAAVDDNFGGTDEFPRNYFSEKSSPISRPRIHSAYMLVYVSESELSSVLCTPQVEEAQDRVLAENKRIDERKKMQEKAKEMITVVVGSEHYSVKRDLTVDELAIIITQNNSELAKHTVLFHWAPRDEAPEWASKGSWSLMPRTFTPSSNTTPKSARLAGGSLFSPSPNGIAKTLADFDSDTLEVHPIHSETELLSEWTDASLVSLVALRYFDQATLAVTDLGVHWASSQATLASLVPIVRARLAEKLMNTSDEPPMLVFEETRSGGVSACDLDSTLLSSVSSLIFQSNSILDAETEDEDDGLNFPVRTMADYVRGIESKTTCNVLVHEANEPLQTDGILANGEETVQAAECGTKLVMHADMRWSVKTFVSQVKELLHAKKIQWDDGKHRLDMFDHIPSLSREPPIGDLGDVKLGSIVHNIKQWNLHVVAIPIGYVSVRVFDDAVREVSATWVPEGEYLVSELVKLAKCSPGTSWQAVRVRKAKITDIQTETVSLTASTRNAVFEYIRLEPLLSVPEGYCPCWVSHVDRNSGIAFGYPFAVALPKKTSVRTAKQLIQQKLGIAERWRVCVQDGHLSHLKDDDEVPVDESMFHIVLEQTHPNPVLIGGHKAHAPKPLTIR